MVEIETKNLLSRKRFEKKLKENYIYNNSPIHALRAARLKHSKQRSCSEGSGHMSASAQVIRPIFAASGMYRERKGRARWALVWPGDRVAGYIKTRSM
jgi:hypothetical protein